MCIVLFVVTPILMYLGMLSWGSWRYDRPRVVNYKRPVEALQSLIEDVKRAKRSVLVVCDKCKLDEALKENVAELLSTLKRKHDEGVEAIMIVHKAAPTQLKELEKAGVIRIVQSQRPVPFTAPIIDGKRVSRYLGAGGEMYPAGNYATANYAPRIALALGIAAMAAYQTANAQIVPTTTAGHSVSRAVSV